MRDFFNPNYKDGKAKTFDRIDALADEIHTIQGKDLTFEIVFMGYRYPHGQHINTLFYKRKRS